MIVARLVASFSHSEALRCLGGSRKSRLEITTFVSRKSLIVDVLAIEGVGLASQLEACGVGQELVHGGDALCALALVLTLDQVGDVARQTLADARRLVAS